MPGGLHPVFEPGTSIAIARGAAAAAVWMGVRDVASWLEQPGIRRRSAGEAAALLRDAMERETGER